MSDRFHLFSKIFRVRFRDILTEGLRNEQISWQSERARIFLFPMVLHEVDQPDLFVGHARLKLGDDCP